MKEQLPTQLPRRYWAVGGCLTFDMFVHAADLLTDGAGTIVLEDVRRNERLAPVVRKLGAEESVSANVYGLGGFGCRYDVALCPEAVDALTALGRSDAAAAICCQAYVLKDGQVQAMWFDPGAGPLVLDASVAEDLVRSIASEMGAQYTIEECRDGS